MKGDPTPDFVTFLRCYGPKPPRQEVNGGKGTGFVWPLLGYEPTFCFTLFLALHT